MNAICKMTKKQTTWPCAAPSCPLYGDCIAEFCGMNVKQKTNSDLIRGMSDEELAIFLSDWAQKPWAWKKDAEETQHWLQQLAEPC